MQDKFLEENVFKWYKNGFFVDVIGFENNYNDSSIPIIKYLQDRNFQIIYKSLDIFMINKQSIFVNNIIQHFTPILI